MMFAAKPAKHVQLPRGVAYYLKKRPDIIELLHEAGTNSFSANHIITATGRRIYDVVSITRYLVSNQILEKTHVSGKSTYEYRLSLQGKLWIDSQFAGYLSANADAAESAGSVL